MSHKCVIFFVCFLRFDYLIPWTNCVEKCFKHQMMTKQVPSSPFPLSVLENNKNANFCHMKGVKSTLHRGGEGQNAWRAKFSNTYGQGFSCLMKQFQANNFIYFGS